MKTACVGIVLRYYDDDTVHLCFDTADTSIALATGSINAMLEWLEEQSGTLAIPA